MHFVEDDPFDITDQIRALWARVSASGGSEVRAAHLVQHTPQDLSRHDQARRLGVDLHIAGQDADRGGRERVLEVAELLVRERLDRRGVDGAVFSSGQANSLELR